MAFVAGQSGFEQGQLEIKAAGAIDEGAEIFGQAGAAEGEAGFQIGSRGVEFDVLANGIHDFAGIDARCWR
jgi:hypothetical protein